MKGRYRYRIICGLECLVGVQGLLRGQVGSVGWVEEYPEPELELEVGVELEVEVEVGGMGQGKGFGMARGVSGWDKAG